MSKIGRNDPCPCGNGKKYKRCHGGIEAESVSRTKIPPLSVAKLIPTEVTPKSQTQLQRFTVKKVDPSAVPPQLLRKVDRQITQNRAFTAQFGHVRQPISAEFNGFRFVAVGNRLLYQAVDRAQFFTDILINYVPTLFGKEWFDAEVAKPRGSRHPVMEARVKAMTVMNKQPKNTDGSFQVQLTGPMLGYFTFAYDLFIVQDNGRLDERLLDRLKHPNTFQGARHELFAEATCLRAGFTIAHEDETDGSTRHAEFTAIHHFTGQPISVEAKSKHRPGVLGYPGTVEVEGQHNLKVGQLLNDAIRKNPPHPLVVFLELNLPWNSADRLLGMCPPRPPHPIIQNTLDRMRKRHNDKDPINLLVATNHPEHYSTEEEAAPSPQLLSIQSEIPLRPAVRPDALFSIHQAANLYGRIPQFFPGNER